MCVYMYVFICMNVCLYVKQYTSISVSTYPSCFRRHTQLFSLGNRIIDHVYFLLYGSSYYLKL